MLTYKFFDSSKRFFWMWSITAKASEAIPPKPQKTPNTIVAVRYAGDTMSESMMYLDPTFYTSLLFPLPPAKVLFRAHSAVNAASWLSVIG